jgi:hypothetical protein
MWCIFVAMTTGYQSLILVGYGDFYGSTHLGRFICIIACVVGIYFVSMMMTNMTQKSVLKENEYKAYKLIMRLNAKDEIKNLKAKMIYYCCKLKILKDQRECNKIDDKIYELSFNRERQNVYNMINEIKSYEKVFSSIDLTVQDHLYEISNRIDLDFKDFEKEIDNLRGKINFMKKLTSL